MVFHKQTVFICETIEVKVNFNQLFIVAKVAKHQSFTKAARKLAIEKSTPNLHIEPRRSPIQS